ncbi:hypothetical protein GCM10007079_31670 [Nocardiopsis terrae]|nr:hypothetical protein GCM10007079_31670 [Nocardiopsis terrae]
MTVGPVTGPVPATGPGPTGKRHRREEEIRMSAPSTDRTLRHPDPMPPDPFPPAPMPPGPVPPEPGPEPDPEPGPPGPIPDPPGPEPEPEPA